MSPGLLEELLEGFLEGSPEVLLADCLKADGAISDGDSGALPARSLSDLHGVDILLCAAVGLAQFHNAATNAEAGPFDQEYWSPGFPGEMPRVPAGREKRPNQIKERKKIKKK